MKKIYGQSYQTRCFCGKLATSKNKQGIPVCHRCKTSKLKDIKCACGKHLELRNGKFGPYFNCLNCGNVSFRKALALNPQKVSRKEITITSDKVDYFF